MELFLAEHRHCARHVFAHWHRYHRGDEMKKLFWDAAHAYNETELEEALEEMNKVSPAAVDAFRAYNPECFCRAYVSTHTKCDVIVNNMAETFNGYIVGARSKHLIFMLEEIRSALMQRIVTKREEMMKNNDTICPRIRVKLNKEKHLAADCGVMPSTVTLFQVSHRLDTVTVDLQNHTCTCRRWELTGIPCSHACACIFFKYEEPEQYVADCYKKDTYLSIYSASIPPCVWERHWPKVDLPLDPPPIKVGPGRPRKNRRKTPFEDPKRPGKLTKHGVEMSCSVCKSKQHNKRKCPDKDKVVEPQPKRGRGRPKKVVKAASVDQNLTQQNQHHHQIAQPTATGRHARVIIRGRGRGSRGGNTVVGGGRGGFTTIGGDRGSTTAVGSSRTGSTAAVGGRSGGRGAVRGGRSGGRGVSGRGAVRGGRSGGRGGYKVPQGFGVFIDENGNCLMNEPRRGLVNISKEVGSTSASVPH